MLSPWLSEETRQLTFEEIIQWISSLELQAETHTPQVSEAHNASQLVVFHLCIFTGPKVEITVCAQKIHNEPLFMALYGQHRIKSDPVSTNQYQSVS